MIISTRPITFAGILFAVLLVGCGKQPDPQPASVPKYSAEVFFATTSYGLASPNGYAFSPDNTKILIHSDESGIFNVYALPVGGGEPVPMTHSGLGCDVRCQLVSQ